MNYCNLCYQSCPGLPEIAMECLRPNCTAHMFACLNCCKDKQKTFGRGWEGFTRSLLEVRHLADHHPSVPEGRS